MCVSMWVPSTRYRKRPAMQKATMARPSVAFDKVSVKPQQSFEDAIDNSACVPAAQSPPASKALARHTARAPPAHDSTQARGALAQPVAKEWHYVCRSAVLSLRLCCVCVVVLSCSRHRLQ